MQALFDSLILTFNKSFPTLSLELFEEHQGIGIVIRSQDHPSTFVSVSVSNNVAYIHMINSEVKRQGLGTQLMLSLVFVLSKLHVPSLSGHLTSLGILKLLQNMYGNKILFYKKTFLGNGKQITDLLEVEQSLDSSGCYFFVDL